MTTEGRQNVLFITIDRPDDVDPGWHQPNIDGVAAAAAAVDPSLVVQRVAIDDLVAMDAVALDATWSPVAIFGAGSWSEWYQYGLDPAWKAKLDNYMAIIRETRIPMLAVCGSHQLVSAAFNGWSAVAHMNDAGAPVPIADELSLAPAAPLFPDPRVGEEGTYPVAITDAGVGDPIVATVGDSPLATVHHKDLVVDFTGFTLLCTSDPGRAADSSAPSQAVNRCAVQALRRDDGTRLLYSTQFHPEISRFAESTSDDGGLGQRWIAAFLGNAREWWTTTGA